MSDGNLMPNSAKGVTEIKSLEEHASLVFKTSLHAILPFIEDPDVQEIMVNRPDEVWVERHGEMKKVNVEISNVHVESAVRALASANNKDVGLVLDCRMPGFRIAAALTPVAIRGAAICIRKHSLVERTLYSYRDAGGFGPLPHLSNRPVDRPADDLVRKGGDAVREFLTWMIRSRQNAIIAGGTSSGKTTFLNALLTEVPDDQRVLTIEDTAELRVKTPNHVGLESMPDEGVNIRSLVRLALRFRPDRIFVGEVRGAESYDFLDAMNTGHSGGACSLHADSPELALSRIESMVRMNESASTLPHQVLREQIASTFQFVVFCSRRGNRRGPEQIVEVLGVDPNGHYITSPIFDARELNHETI